MFTVQSAVQTFRLEDLAFLHICYIAVQAAAGRRYLFILDRFLLYD